MGKSGDNEDADAETIWLARVLYEEMERLDPNGDPPWHALTALERHFYRVCVQTILREYEAGRVRQAGKASPTTT
jgi:hypothetical protein